MTVQLLAVVMACLSSTAVACCAGYGVVVRRRTAYIRSELAQLQSIGTDAWVAKQIQRWERGELPMRFHEAAPGVRYRMIEPLPGWRISVEGQLARLGLAQ